MLLIDSTLLISWMRSGRNPVRVLAPFLEADLLCSCGVVRAEVIRGVRDLRAKREQTLLSDVIPEILTDASLWQEVAEIAWRLDRSGVVLPLSDVVIAACGIRAGAEIVSLNHHFGCVPGVRWRQDLPAN